jgi:hypothetical protein
MTKITLRRILHRAGPYTKVGVKASRLAPQGRIEAASHYGGCRQEALYDKLAAEGEVHA